MGGGGGGVGCVGREQGEEKNGVEGSAPCGSIVEGDWNEGLKPINMNNI